MKTFQFKDLMINVAATGERALFCAPGTVPYCNNRTCYIYTPPLLQPAQETAARIAGGGVTAAGAICFGFTPPCGFPTVRHCAQDSWQALGLNVCGTGPTFLACEAATATVPLGPTIQVDPEAVASQLAAVKAQLQQELAAIETQQQIVSESLRPQTVADVEELQGKLRDALSELDQRKQELQKPAKSASANK